MSRLRRLARATVRRGRFGGATRPTHPALLLAYQPGWSLAGATFARAGAAVQYGEQGLVATPPGVPRAAHLLAGVRTLLLEPASSNKQDTSDLGRPSWGRYNGTFALVAGPAGDSGSAVEVRNSQGLGTGAYGFAWALAGGTTYTYSVFVRVNPARPWVQLKVIFRAGSALGTVSLDFNAAAGTTAGAVGGATGRLVPAFDGWTRLVLTATAPAGTTYAEFDVLFPTTAAAGPWAANDWQATAWFAQCEPGGIATSPMISTNVNGSRPAESLSVPVRGGAGQRATRYEHYVDLATGETVEEVAPWTTDALFALTPGRAYRAVRVASGARTLAEMQALHDVAAPPAP